MKKFLSTLLALSMCLSLAAVPAGAEESTDVYVTIASAGTLVAAQEKVTVTDIDGDSALTINDALYCAHDALYEGGAEAGYGSGETQYGLSLNKLWGVENGGSYGYYVNNASAWSLADPVKNGDYINAYSYSDLTAWSDAYAYFDVNTVETSCGEDVTLTLYKNGYDENWNRVALPCEGATVTAGGAAYTTDADGKVTISFAEAGSYVVTATSETATLVPPVCVVNVAAVVEPVDVYVTIASAGTLVAAQEKVTVTDIDGDSALTINDALYCAHDVLYEGGAEAGYGSGETQYGLSLNKLWGVENGGSYGYYVNNASAWSLADPVKDGDYINAYSYSDLTAWSDAYAYFDVNTVESSCGEDVTLTLYKNGYDENWNRVALPCEGATVTAGGAAYTTDADGKVTISFAEAGSYVVTATSETATLVPPVCVATVRTFADTVGIWSADAIENVIAQGLFNGTDKGFEPELIMNRAMLVTVLYRMDGSPAVSGEAAFADVQADSYYASAVLWANANGIVTGYDSKTFAPDDNITREQMATILWRYAKHKSYDVSQKNDLLSFVDAAEVSEYALPAMQWACGAGIINGKTADTLEPAGSATREQVAVILDRFAGMVK